MKEKTKRLTLIGIFSAIAFLAAAVGRIPISSVEFLKYDPKDIFVVIAGFFMGPVEALIITVVSSLIEMVTVSTTGFIGLVMNIISTAGFSVTASIIYKKLHNLKGAVIGLIAGTLTATSLMLLWNYFITPVYMGIPRQAVADMLVPVFLPFNLIKYGINSSLTMILYKPVSKAIHKSHFFGDGENTPYTKKNVNTATVIISLLVLISCILWVLIIKKYI